VDVTSLRRRTWRGIPVGAWLFATAILLVVAAAGAVLVAGGDGDGSAGELEPFYLEAEVIVVDRSTTVGTNLPPSGEEEEHTSHLRWWHRDATHARWELPGFTGVLDGRDMWFYDEEQNTYSKQPLPDLPPGATTAGIPVSVTLGPANAANREEFMEGLKDRGADRVAIVGEDTVLGRRVTVIEMSPASRSESRSSDSRGGSSPTATPEIEATGTVRYWLDEERMLVLRYEVRDIVADITASVTRLDYPADIPDDVVTFEPPPGATEQD